MADECLVNETLIQQLPLPLAQLYRRAHNAKSPLQRHLTAFSLWEAILKLLSSVAVVEYARLKRADPELAAVLQNLARPTLGQWWDIARALVPILADQGDSGFQKVRDLLLGKARNDLPRAAGLSAALLEETKPGKGGAKPTLLLAELFDRLVNYRNTGLFHAAPGQLPDAVNERMSTVLLTGAADVLGKFDVLADRRLVYVGEVRQSGGVWQVQRFALQGECPQLLPTLRLAQAEISRLAGAQRIYMENSAGELHLLHPLLLYDAEEEEVLFLNACRGKGRTEYLCYTSGRTRERPDLGGEQRELLAKVLQMAVTDSDVAAWSARSQASDPDAPVQQEPSPARRTLGEFELLSELGKGGMGVVYRAWQPSLSRQVALKKLLRAGDPKTEARFRREIRALGKVDHPHLVKVFTSGTEEEQLFFAMELVEGATLSAICERLEATGASAAALDITTWHSTVGTVCSEARRAEKPLSGTSTPAKAAELPTPPAPASGHNHVRHMVELVWQVTQAAHALHHKRVIHRDIKPGNIMVTADGANAVLMDLGLAQIADDEEGRVTRTRQFVGTLRYASPQQVLAVSALDARTDVYSLGATLWELLTLRPIYGATEATPTPELMEMIQRQEPERPRKYNPAVKSDLEAIVFKCLEKDPKQRYATAAELGEDLRRYLDGAPVAARPVGRLERAVKWARRYPARATAALLAVAMVVLAGGGATIAWLWLEAEHARGQAEVERQNAQTARKKAEEERTQAEAAQHLEMLARKNEEQAKNNLEIQLKINNKINHDLETAKRKLARILYFDRISFAWTLWQAGDQIHSAELLASCDEDYRNWEWHQLNVKTRHLRTLTAHTGQVNQISYSPDGQRLASASGDQTVKIWDAANGKELATLAGHKGPVEQVSFSPDGKRLATAGHDNTAKLWDASSGKELATLAGPKDLVEQVSFSPVGQQLATANRDNVVKLWDASSGKVLAKLTGHTNRVAHLCYSPNGQRLATASEDRTAKIWDTNTGKALATLKGHQDKIVHVSFSPTGRQLATASEDNTVKLWDAITGKEFATLVGHMDWVFYVCYSPDGRRLASLSLDGTVKLWDAGSGKEMDPLWHSAKVAHVCFSPDSLRLATASEDQTIDLWSASGGKKLATLRGHTHRIVQVLFSPDGQRLASASEDKTVRLWDSSSGKELAALAHDDVVLHVIFSPDAQRLASASRDRKVKIWDATSSKEVARLEQSSIKYASFSPDGQRLATAGAEKVSLWDAPSGRELAVLWGHKGFVNHLSFSSDGKQLATASEDKTVRIWDLTAGEELATLAGHKDKVVQVSFSPAGQRLISSSEDNAVKLWDANSFKEIATLTGHKAKVAHVGFSPDGRRIVSASDDAALMLWDAWTGKQLATLVGHKDRVEHACFSPDGRLLASASHDKTVKLWDAVSGKELATLAGHNNAVVHVCFSPDSQRLASASVDETVKLWDVPSGAELATLVGHMKRVTDVSFSPDGQRLTSASMDGTLKLWDAHEGKELATLKGHNAGVLQVQFSADGQRLASRSAFGEALLWFGNQSPAAWEQRQAVQLEKQAADAFRSNQWFAAAFHFEVLVQRQPNNVKLLTDLARAQAESLQWDKACATFARAAALEPNVLQLRYDLALAELARGNARAYRAICREVLRDFGPTNDAKSLFQIAWLGVLFPDPVDDARQWVRLAKIAADKQDRQWDYITCLGAAYYRAGEWEDALGQLNLAIKLLGKGGKATTHLFLAMTHHKLGHDDEARQWLDQANRYIGQVDYDNWMTWNSRAYTQLLHWEAQTLILKKGPKKQ